MKMKELGEQDMNKLRLIFQNTQVKFLQNAQNVCFLTHQQWREGQINLGPQGIAKKSYRAPIFPQQHKSHLIKAEEMKESHSLKRIQLDKVKNQMSLLRSSLIRVPQFNEKCFLNSFVSQRRSFCNYYLKSRKKQLVPNREEEAPNPREQEQEEEGVEFPGPVLNIQRGRTIPSTKKEEGKYKG